MQKFTRPLTREIEVGGQRLALTFSDQGLSVRPVGSRRPPRETSWAALLCQLVQTNPEGRTPSTADLAAALETLKGEAGPGSKTRSMGAAPADSDPAAANDGSSSASLREVLDRLDCWLAEHRRRYQEGLLPGARSEEMEALQATLGVPLPEDLRVLLTWHNGQSDDYVGAFEQTWKLMNTQQITLAKQALDSQADGEGAVTGWHPAWIPFLDNDIGDYLCLDTSQPGAPVREFWQGRSEHAAIAPSLAEWLREMVSRVERGEYYQEPERGGFFRRRCP